MPEPVQASAVFKFDWNDASFPFIFLAPVAIVAPWISAGSYLMGRASGSPSGTLWATTLALAPLVGLSGMYFGHAGWYPSISTTSHGTMPSKGLWLKAFVLTSLVGLSGYYFGRHGLRGLSDSYATPASSRRRKILAKREDTDSEDCDEDEHDSSALASFPEHANEECKMVLVVRTDLGMSSGKIAAQCSHATLACYKAFLRKAPNSPVLKAWESLGQAKITLQVKSEEELQMLQAQAVSLGLAAEIIHDAGRTEIASGTATVLGIGPAPKSVMNQVTGQLRLLR